MNIANFCDTFRIEGEVDDELYDYIDKFQRKSLQKALNSYKDEQEILMYLRNCLQVLFDTCIDGKILYSFGNDFRICDENNKIQIFWKIQNPTSQLMKFEYELKE